MESLNEINLDQLKEADLDNEEIIKLLIDISKVENVKPYTEYFKVLRSKYNEMLEMIPLEVDILAMRDVLNPKQLRNIYVAWEDVGYKPLFYDTLRSFQQDQNASLYIQRLNTAFGMEPDEDFCQEVLHFIHEDRNDYGDANPTKDFCDEFLPTGSRDECQKYADLIAEERNELSGPGVTAIENYLVNLLGRISHYQTKPKYIQEFEIDPDDLPKIITRDIPLNLTYQEIARKLLEANSLYSVIIAGNGSSDDPTEAAIEELADQLSKLSSEKLDKYITPFKVDLEQVQAIQTDRNLFRVFGPVNPHPDDDYSILTTLDEDGNEVPDIEKIYGGPRMFLSMEYEFDEDEDFAKDTWFTGSCFQCLRRIHKLCYARRKAMLRGGWYGCFCCFECVRSFIAFNSDMQDSEEYKLVELELALNQEFDKLLNDIGIAERGEEEEEEEESTMEPIEDQLDLLSL